MYMHTVTCRGARSSFEERRTGMLLGCQLYGLEQPTDNASVPLPRQNRITGRWGDDRFKDCQCSRAAALFGLVRIAARHSQINPGRFAFAPLRSRQTGTALRTR